MDLYRQPAGRLIKSTQFNHATLAYARRKGMVVEGCDLSETVCEAVRKRMGVSVFHGDVADLPSGRDFDVVVMNHVLEHVCSPTKFLQDARLRLREGGLLHLAVPNIECWEAFFSGWPGYEPYHFTYFSRDTLGAAVERAGFSIIRAGTHESFSGWFLTWLRSVASGATGGAQCLAGHRGRRRRNRWLEHCYRSAMVLAGAATFPVRAVQSVAGRGDELFLLARKCD